MNAVNLRTEHMRNPIGIDIVNPYLTWNCDGGKRQTAYEIRAVCDGEAIWDSGKVLSNEMQLTVSSTV